MHRYSKFDGRETSLVYHRRCIYTLTFTFTCSTVYHVVNLYMKIPDQFWASLSRPAPFYRENSKQTSSSSQVWLKQVMLISSSPLFVAHPSLKKRRATTQVRDALMSSHKTSNHSAVPEMDELETSFATSDLPKRRGGKFTSWCNLFTSWCSLQCIVECKSKSSLRV